MGWSTDPNLGTQKAHIPHAAGRFYHPPVSSNTATLAISANVLYAVPFFVPETKTYTSINIEVVVTGAGSVRMGIYQDSGSAPGARVLDAGTVSVSTTGGKSIAISQGLAAGWYWLVLVSDVAPTLRAISNTSGTLPWLGFTSNTDTTFHVGWSVAFTYAALPDPFTGGGALMTTAAPRILLGV